MTFLKMKAMTEIEGQNDKQKETEDRDFRYGQGQKSLNAHSNLTFGVSSVLLLSFKPPGNKAGPACQGWVESATIRGQGCSSDVKEGIESCFVL